MIPYPFQKQVLNEIDWFRGRCLLALEQGLGKTLISLWWLKRREAIPVIVVCPGTVKFVWQYESQRVGLSCEVISGRSPYRLGSADVTVINYDILLYWLNYLERNYKCLIIDECHYIGNHRAKRTRAVKRLAAGIPYVLALSGTPVLNRPYELHTTLSILCPKLFPSRWEFLQRYCHPVLTPWGWQYKGVSNVEELHSILTRRVMIRRRKEEVLDSLPPKIRSTIPIPISVQDYHQLLRNLRSNNERGEVSKAQSLIQEVARLKLNGAIEWIRNLLDTTGEKVVIFGVHKEIIESLCSALHSYGCVKIDGDTPMEKRSEIVSQFQHVPKVRVFVGNVLAAGTGITLTASSNVLFVELPWRPSDILQAEDRCHRIGTHRPVWVYYLVAQGTIEEKICRIIEKKQNIINSVIDGGSGEELDLLALMKEELFDVCGRSVEEVEHCIQEGGGPPPCDQGMDTNRLPMVQPWLF